MAECAVVLPFLLVGMFLLLDLGMRVAQSNSLSDCARHAARFAAVHGSEAGEPLGPDTWTGTLDENNSVAGAVRERLMAMSPADVTLTVTWPDGNNEPSSRVYVQLNYSQQAILSGWSGYSNISAQSSMRILR